MTSPLQACWFGLSASTTRSRCWESLLKGVVNGISHCLTQGGMTEGRRELPSGTGVLVYALIAGVGMACMAGVLLWCCHCVRHRHGGHQIHAENGGLGVGEGSSEIRVSMGFQVLRLPEGTIGDIEDLRRLQMTITR